MTDSESKALLAELEAIARAPGFIYTLSRPQEMNYDEEKKASIYKFANDQSHITGSGFDPSLVPEAKNCVTDLLDMIKAVDPDHFKYLEEGML